MFHLFKTQGINKMKFDYLKKLSAHEVSDKLFVRVNKETNEHVLVFFDTRFTLECLICSDGKKYDFDGNCLYAPEYCITKETHQYHNNQRVTETNTSVTSPERAKVQLQESLKVRLQEDIELFNKELSRAISNGNGLFWVDLPSVERVKQLAEFVSSKGYAVKAIQGLFDTYIEVQL